MLKKKEERKEEKKEEKKEERKEEGFYVRKKKGREGEDRA